MTTARFAFALTLSPVLLAMSAQAASGPAEPSPIIATTFYRTFSHAHPVLKQIKPGETVVTKTLDAGGQDERSVKRSEPGNPLTGPFLNRPSAMLAVYPRKVRLNHQWTANRSGCRATPEAGARLFHDGA